MKHKKPMGLERIFISKAMGFGVQSDFGGKCMSIMSV